MQTGKNDDLNALVGKSLGQDKFRIVERIGAGGMATVFKAYQPNLDRYVAIKVLPAYFARNTDLVKRFVKEAKAVAKLVHPNILQIHDFGDQDNITYIVMEYVEGGTLKERLKRELTVPEAINYMIQAAEGLDCAHRNGIIHRDVKPANMLLRNDGYLLLSDFGIAKSLEETTNLTRAGTSLGTPQYMSPEQGTGQAVDRRSDIYSLGIVFFHCLTGQVPFTADNPLAITVKHLNDPLPVELLRAARVPLPIQQVVVKMTEKSAQDRYQTTDELIVALTDALVASHLSMPPRWRPGLSSSMPQLDLHPNNNHVSTPLPSINVASGSSNVGQVTPGIPGVSGVSGASNVANGFAQPKYTPGAQSQQQIVTLPCFRCGASNPSSRLFCTSCGYELSDKGAANDHYMGPNGRPILARLTIQNGSMSGHSYLFHQGVTTIGRTNGNDLIISERTVSRRHARLWFDNGRWFLQDLQSANGTLLNNTKVLAPVALKDGDVINFGDEIVVFNTTY